MWVRVPPGVHTEIFIDTNVLHLLTDCNSYDIFATLPIALHNNKQQALFAASVKKWFIGHKFANTPWVIYFRSWSRIRDLSRSDNNVTTATVVGSSFLLHAVFTWDGQLGKCEICDSHSGES